MNNNHWATHNAFRQMQAHFRLLTTSLSLFSVSVLRCSNLQLAGLLFSYFSPVTLTGLGIIGINGRSCLYTRPKFKYLGVEH